MKDSRARRKSSRLSPSHQDIEEQTDETIGRLRFETNDNEAKRRLHCAAALCHSSVNGQLARPSDYRYKNAVGLGLTTLHRRLPKHVAEYGDTVLVARHSDNSRKNPDL